MGALRMIVRGEFGQRTFQRALPEQDQLRQAFLLDRADPSFGKGIRVSFQMRRMATLRTDLSE